jgi:uncharacterized membrane protein YbaN (DUF454 family)
VNKAQAGRSSGGIAWRRLNAAIGWAAFGLGWLGIFLPGLPTTIFWIIAAFAFLRSNRRMYERIVANKRFGPGVRLFVEEGKIRKSGKIISIVAMMSCATIGSFAIPIVWVRFIVVVAALVGSAWVASLPMPEPVSVKLTSALIVESPERRHP